jgi:hypothetical protein
MNIFEKIAIFLLRALGAWAIYLGLDSIIWYELYHFKVWTPTSDYTASWAIAGVIKLVSGVLIFVFSHRLGSLFGGDLGSGGGVA